MPQVDPTPTANSPRIAVPANAGLIDGVQSALRSIGFLITASIAILGLLKVHDIAGIIAYIQANGGQVLSSVSGLIAFALAAYGAIKAHRRGAQIAAAGKNRRVPEDVVTIK